MFQLLPKHLFLLYQNLLFVFEGAFFSNVLYAKQDCGVRALLIEDFTGIQEHRAPADAREIMLDFVVFHGSLLGNVFSNTKTESRNIPFTVSRVIEKFALSVVGIDFERQIERSARSNDPQILIEDNERFSNRVDDSVRKYPRILDLGKLLSEHVSEHVGYPRRGGSLRNSQSAARPSAAEDSCTPTICYQRRNLMP